MSGANDKAWGLVAAHLPERPDGGRVLEVGQGTAESVLGDRGFDKVVTVPWPTPRICALLSRDCATWVNDGTPSSQEN